MQEVLDFTCLLPYIKIRAAEDVFQSDLNFIKGGVFVRKEINHFVYNPLTCSVASKSFAEEFDFREMKLVMTVEEIKNLAIMKLKYMPEFRSGN